MDNLKTLYISDTDIDSGLEYLPESLEAIYCSNEEETNSKCSLIKNTLKKCEDEKVYRVGAGTEGVLYYDYKK